MLCLWHAVTCFSFRILVFFCFLVWPGCFTDLVVAFTYCFDLLHSSFHQGFPGGSLNEEQRFDGIERSAAWSIASLIFEWYISMSGEARSVLLYCSRCLLEPIYLNLNLTSRLPMAYGDNDFSCSLLHIAFLRWRTETETSRQTYTVPTLTNN